MKNSQWGNSKIMQCLILKQSTQLQWIFLSSQPWPEDALERVAVKFLEKLELTENERQEVVPICKHFHTSVLSLSERLSFYIICDVD